MAKRPIGLTILAVLNFLFAAVALWAAVGIYDLATSRFDGRGGRMSIGDNPDPWQIYLLLAAALTIAGLLVASGIGYLLRRRFLGRAVGNAFVVVSIGTAIAVAASTASLLGGIAIACALYPIITGALINGAWKTELTA